MTKQKQIDLGEADFKVRPPLSRHLAFESFVALARRPRRELIVDHTLQRRGMKSGFLLAAAFMLSRRMAGWTSKPRVGIVFPPGLGGYIANLAVVFSGKVPVNLNFTLGPNSAASCLEKAGIDCLLTTERVRQKMPNFPWPDTGIVDLVDELKSLPKVKTLGLLGWIHLCPSKLLAKILKIPAEGGDREAGLLFTSGSSGEPKGVVLTHRNILGNCAQIDSSGLLPESEKLLANLPIFHSFGFTVTLWYPLLRGCAVATLPTPLDVKKNAEVIASESVSILVGTPTFFKPYFKRVEATKLKTIKCVIAGAEKTPEGFADAWESQFGGQYLEGYGLTETSPVVSVNLPTKPSGVDYPGESTEGSRRGSVGRLMPGHAARILDPDTFEERALNEVGLLSLRGANIFSGYLEDPDRTAEVLQDGWFSTGDLARFDDDGFLYIEGRLSRFSKIGGEMVPHGTVEEILIQAYGLEESEAPVLAVAGRPDAAKGEALVLLTTIDIEMSDMREKLSAAGLTNLWVPREIRRVEAIPTLATGKLDLRGINEMAQT